MSGKTFADFIFEWRRKRYREVPKTKTEEQLMQESFQHLQNALKKRREGVQLSKI